MEINSALGPTALASFNLLVDVYMQAWRADGAQGEHRKG